MTVADLEYNGQVDTTTNSQYYEALQTVIEQASEGLNEVILSRLAVNEGNIEANTNNINNNSNAIIANANAIADVGSNSISTGDDAILNSVTTDNVAIKNKKISGTFSSGLATVSHGLTKSKILGVSVITNLSTIIDSSVIGLCKSIGNSTLELSKGDNGIDNSGFTVLITYES